MTKYEQYLARGRVQHGERFNPPAPAGEFVDAFNSGERVTVQFGYGETLKGTISITTGWAPVFLLMRTKRSLGSSDTINPDRDRIVR
jgi:hypothetical protein